MTLAPEYDVILFDNDGVLTELTGSDLLRTAARDAFVDVGAVAATD